MPQTMTLWPLTTVATATTRAWTPAERLVASLTMVLATMADSGASLHSVTLAQTVRTVAGAQARSPDALLLHSTRPGRRLHHHRRRALTCPALRAGPVPAATRTSIMISARMAHIQTAGTARGASLPTGPMQTACMPVSRAARVAVASCKGRAASVRTPSTSTPPPLWVTRAASLHIRVALTPWRATTSQQLRMTAATVCLQPLLLAARTRQRLTSTPRLHAAAHARIRFADALTRGHATIHRRARSTTAAAARAAWLHGCCRRQF